MINKDGSLTISPKAFADDVLGYLQKIRPRVNGEYPTTVDMVSLMKCFDTTDNDEFSDPQRVYDIIKKINPRHTYTLCAVNNQRVDVGIDGIVKTVSNSTCSIQ